MGSRALPGAEGTRLGVGAAPGPSGGTAGRPGGATSRAGRPDDATGVRRALLVLDFDGTLWRGNEPLESYAVAASHGLVPAEREPYLAAVRAFLGGARWRVVGTAAPPEDGWSAVASFALARGASQAQLRDAFLRVREDIAAGAFHMEVPAGLVDFLAWSRRWCRVVVATNSPASSVEPVLDRLGLAGLLDDIAAGASKPGSLVWLVEGWAERYGVSRERVMSIGDHYRNDIEPAVRAGWSTAYITPWRWVPGPCSLVGTRVEELLPGLREWVETVAAGPNGRGEPATTSPEYPTASRT